MQQPGFIDIDARETRSRVQKQRAADSPKTIATMLATSAQNAGDRFQVLGLAKSLPASAGFLRDTNNTLNKFEKDDELWNVLKESTVKHATSIASLLKRPTAVQYTLYFSHSR